MKFINKNTDYAARALMTLASNKGKYMSVMDISMAQKIPYQFLRRVMQPLIKNKMVVSREGALGGVKLFLNPKDIRIMDLVRIYHEKVELSECTFRGKPCANRAHCVLRKEVTRIEKQAFAEFEKLTIKKLLQK
jgi:Rrf2 family protein